MDKQTKEKKSFLLPSEVTGSADLTRLIRELEELNDFLYQTKIRSPGTSVKPPKTSVLLEDLAKSNHYSIFDDNHRVKLLAGLKRIGKSAPKIHVSFAVRPSANFTKKIVAWMRESLHPYLLVDIGLQPGIAVGCVVRTDNKIFDLSLKNRFKRQKSNLVSMLDKVAADSPNQSETLHER